LCACACVRSKRCCCMEPFSCVDDAAISSCVEPASAFVRLSAAVVTDQSPVVRAQACRLLGNFGGGAGGLLI
jgi:hypothetical protein